MPSNALARSRKPRRGTELVCEWVFRPLAHPLVLLFARLRVPPPAVVVAAGAAGIAACRRARARLAARRRAPRPAQDAARQRGRPARAAHRPHQRVRPLPRLGGRPARQRGALRRARLDDGQPALALAGFLALTSVLSLNFNVERLSRAAAAEPEAAEDAPTAVLRRVYGVRLRAAGPARRGARRAAARRSRARRGRFACSPTSECRRSSPRSDF